LAFLHRAIQGPRDQEEWADLWAADELPMARIRSYADRVRSRFNLFDESVPFYQVAGLRTQKDTVSGLEKVVADVPAGEPLFTTRSAADLQRISAAEAARWLVHTHAFDPSGIKSGAVGDPTVKWGKGYPIGTGWSGQLGGVLLTRRDIRETLLLNLISFDMERYVRIGGQDDLPPWERPPDTSRWAEERIPTGAIDLYTWQTRRVRLSGDRDGVIAVLVSNGDKIRGNNQHMLEPHTAWRYSAPQSKKLRKVVYMPQVHDPRRSVWRGISALLPSVSPRGSGGDPQPYLAPGVCQWVSDLVADGHLPDDYGVRLQAHGAEYGAQQSSTFAEIISDSLPLPVAVLREDHPEAGRTAERAVVDAEGAAYVVWRFAENVAQAAGAEPKSGAGDNARESVYAGLDGAYRRWLGVLGPGTDLDTARRDWQAMVRGVCRMVAAEVVTAAPGAAWTGREINNRLVNLPLAEAWFAAALRNALPGPPPERPND
jgi:CRISPR system Cascade subunit CasA